jgi:hypothetical protein
VLHVALPSWSSVAVNADTVVAAWDTTPLLWWVCVSWPIVDQDLQGCTFSATARAPTGRVNGAAKRSLLTDLSRHCDGVH